MTILTRERFFTASLHVHLGDARQAKAGLLRRDGDRFIATYDPERASLGTAVVLARVILSSEGITVTEVILEGHDPDLTALFHAASKLLLDVEIITGPRITEPAVRVLSQDPTQATYFIPEGWDLSDALERLPAAKDLDEFFNLLADAGLQVETRTLPSGDLGGYKVALPDDGTPIWFSGSSLATDLSLPQIRQRLAATETQPTPASSTRHHRPNPWHVATAATERIPHHLTHADDRAVQAHLTVFGEVLYALPAHAPAGLRAELHRAAMAFEHAAHTRARADHQHARALRGALKAMRYQPADHTALAMLLDAAILVVLAVQRRSALHQHDRQVTAARQTLTHLQAAYAQIVPTSLAALAKHHPSDVTVDRYALALHEVLPRHAEQILTENAWPALTAAETAGHKPATLLQQAAQHRPLDDAKSASEVLVWRIQRLGDRHVSSSQAWGAQARTSRDPSTARITAATPSTSTPQPPRAHRSR